MRASSLLAAVVVVLALAGSAGAVQPALELVEAGSGFSQPVYIASTATDPTAIYVVEQTGTIRRVVNGVTDSTPFLDVSKSIRYGSEQGLLSMAFSPTYSTDHLFYVYYTDKSRKIVVAQYQYQTGAGKKVKPKILLKVGHPKQDNHNGGQLQFGPDGMLYAGLGDGGGAGDPFHNGQNPKTQLAKLLRAGPPSWTWQVAGYGLRNPWRFSFDNGDLYVGDVGQGSREEVDYRTAANLATPANYGWNRYEGTQDYDTSTVLNPADTPATPLVVPVEEYDHTNGDCSIIGGYVYRGSAMTNEVGRYFYSDYCSGKVWSMAAGGGDNRLENITVSWPSSFGVDAANELYVASLGDGKVYRLAESGP